jgi:hypothetical protein
MQLRRTLLCGALVLALLATVAVEPSSASTLIRQSLERLVAGNATIVVGQVLDSHSYWNDEGTFILTDLRIKATDVLKGSPKDTDFTVTLMGGSVGDLTTLIVGGAELVPGKPYVLFLNEGDLPGVQDVRTVRDHSQGVFEVMKARDGLRAISQANRHPLYPDALGFVDPPGGAKGFLLDDMVSSIREMVDRQGARQEVK